MEKKYTVSQIRERLTPVFDRNNVRKAILFGSYVRGNATQNSDIDLMVDSGKKGLAFFGLLEDVCESVECEVDLIDASQIIPGSKVEQEIKKTGIIIYEQ